MNTQTTSPTTTPFSQPYILPNDDVSPHVHNTQHTSPSSSTSSLIIVMIVISSAIILTATIYFTIRYISRRTSNSVNDVVSVNVNINNEHVTEISNNRNDVDSLPLFKFSSLTGNMMTSGDCAVCLSKFESEDQLRLLPLCCHAFHALCIDAWLKSNFTCPLCRSNVNPTEADISRATGTGTGASRSNSFRIEIGSISNRREPSGSRRRSYSVGSFEYVVDIDGYEVSLESTRLRGESDHGDKEVLPGPGENVAAEVGSGRRSWLRRSLRGSGRLFSTGSSRRSENVADDRIGEEISEFFRWFSGV